MKKSLLRVLLVSALGRCPHCEEGRVLKTPFTLKNTCPVCGVRFERSPGEGTGAMMLTLSLVPLPIILVMFAFLLQPGAQPVPIIAAAVFAVIAACLLFYPLARCLWLGVTYAFGGLYTDTEYESIRLSKTK